MEDFADQAVLSALRGLRVFCKFLRADETGENGSRLAGIRIPQSSYSILFDQPGVKGQNKERRVKIRWMDGRETNSRFVYLGKGAKDEYRIKNFGRGFPYLRADYAGALFVLAQDSAENYRAFALNTDNEIELFLGAFAMSPTETNRLIFDRSGAQKHWNPMSLNALSAVMAEVLSFPTRRGRTQSASSYSNPFDDLFCRRD